MKKKYMTKKTTKPKTKSAKKNNQGQHLLTAFPTDNTMDREQQNEECE
jgi:hypothetical protein